MSNRPKVKPRDPSSLVHRRKTAKIGAAHVTAPVHPHLHPQPENHNLVVLSTVASSFPSDALGTACSPRLQQTASADQQADEVLNLCREFVERLSERTGRSVPRARVVDITGHVGFAVVVAAEMYDLARSLAPKHPLLSVFTIVNVAGGPSDVAPLTDEERGFLNYLIEGALASWMLET